MTPSKTLLHRIQKLQKTLQSEKMDGAWLADPTDLLYLTGLKLSCGVLGVCKNKACLFVDGRYFESAQKNCPIAVEKLEEKAQVSFFKECKYLAVNGDKVSHAQFLKLKKLGPKLSSKPEIFGHLRLIKDADEIKKMQKSAHFAYKAYEEIKKHLKTGITELELAKELEIYCLRQGAEKMSFEPIIAFGKNTSLPHHHPGLTKLKKDDIVLLDLGVVVDGYCSDMTRVVFVGKPDPQLKKLFDVNHDAQKAALAKCRPGVMLKELDEAARRVMARAGLEEYFIHSLGHGVGLELHEVPRISKTGVDRNLKLEPGMVITIEPGLYLPGKGGVRYEDTVVITESGVANFYPDI